MKFDTTNFGYNLFSVPPFNIRVVNRGNLGIEVFVCGTALYKKSLAALMENVGF